MHIHTDAHVRTNTHTRTLNHSESPSEDPFVCGGDDDVDSGYGSYVLALITCNTS